jgi:drug/metabolite transporter (DMT)-like permease
MHRAPRRSAAPVEKNRVPLIKLTCCALLWGGALAAGRIVTPHLPTATIVWVRFLLAGTVLTLTLRFREGHLPLPSGKAWFWIILVSLVGIVLFNLLLFSSLKTITAVRSSVMLAFTPSLVALTGALFFRDRITPIMGLGILLSTAGAVLTVTEGNLQAVAAEGLAVGDLYMIAAVAAWAAYSIIIKYAVRHVSPLVLLSYGSAAVVLALLPFVIHEGGFSFLVRLPADALWSLLYLSIGAAGISYLWYYEGIREVGSAKASVFLNLEPVAAIATGVLLLGEPLSGITAVGATLVIGGLYLTTAVTSARGG